MNPCEDSIGIKQYQYLNCTDSQRRHYYSKISKPLLDRIDLQIEVKKVKIEEITSALQAESSGEIRNRVAKARQIQLRRFKNLKHHVFANGQMTNKEIKQFCSLSRQSEDLMNSAVDRLNLSARSYFKILKITRTIADLENRPEITSGHLQEALQYRTLDIFRM